MARLIFTSTLFLVVVLILNVLQLECQKTSVKSIKFSKGHHPLHRTFYPPQFTQMYRPFHRRHAHVKRSTLFRPSDYPNPTYKNYHAGSGFYKKNRPIVLYTPTEFGTLPFGRYLAYRLGVFLSTLDKPFYEHIEIAKGGLRKPPYYVIYHGFLRGNLFSEEEQIEQWHAGTCNDISICVPHTMPLCTSARIYCVTPMNKTHICESNSSLSCINTTLTAPCLNTLNGTCKNFELKREYLEIPCVHTIIVNGYFNKDYVSIINAPGPGFPNVEGPYVRYCVVVILQPLPFQDMSPSEYKLYLERDPIASEKAEAEVKLTSYLTEKLI